MSVRLLLALFLLFSVRAVEAQTCDTSPLLIRNTNVWTPDGILRQRDVVFREGRVAMVETAVANRPSPGRTIDGTGHTLLPGLVDSHLHFSIPGGLPVTAGPRTDTTDITSRQLLRSGVTSGRLHLAALDEAVRLKARSQIDCEAIPRLQVGGPGLSGAAEKDFSAFQGARTVADAEEKVRRFAAAGVDWIAVHDADKFAGGVVQALATAARGAGVRLMASGSTPAEIAAALTIAPDTLDYFDRSAEPGYSPATLDLIRRQRNLILVPTPGVPYRAGIYSARPQLIEEAGNFELLAPADREFVIANAKKDLAGSEVARSLQTFPTIARKLQLLRQLGLPVALGSDAGSTLHFQPTSVWWELEAWRSSGASHREALTAATVGGARVLRQNDVGHLRPGARADFVLYRGDVESGPFDASRVLTVGKSGVVVR